MRVARDREALAELYESPNPATARIYEDIAKSLFVPQASRISGVDVYLKPGVKHARHGDEVKSSAVNRIDDVKNGSPTEPVVRVGSTSAHAPIDGEVARLTTVQSVEQYFERYERFAVVFIRQRNSYAPLSISQQLFETICFLLQIPDRLQNYILYFGEREREVEIASCPVSCRVYEDAKHPTWTIMCNLRFVERNNREDAVVPTNHWSLRQSSVFCKHLPEQCQTSWVFVTLSRAAESRVTRLWSAAADAGALSPLRIILSIYDAAVCNWRPYLVSFGDEIDRHGNNMLGTTPDDRGPLLMGGSQDRQTLLILEHKLSTARLAVQATQADMSSLRDTCQDLSKSYARDGPVEELERLAVAFDDSLRDLNLSLLRIEQLQSKLQSTIQLVSSFLELKNGFALQELSKESKKESENLRKLNERMHQLAEKNTEDSATVRVLAVLTLIYLPVTVVSNFFSTSFVGTAASNNRIFVTQDWWILLATSLPLTIATLYVWKVWSDISRNGTYPVWWPRRVMSHSLVARTKRDSIDSPSRGAEPGPDVERHF